MKKTFALLLALTMVVSLFGGITSTVSAAGDFSDVASTYWAYDVIQKWSNYGVVTGDVDGQGNLTGTFRPEDPMTVAELEAAIAKIQGDAQPSGIDWDASPKITREQAITRVAKFLQLAPVSGYKTGFTDEASIGAAYLPYIGAALKAKIISAEGVGNGVFDPQGNFERSHIMQFLDNIFSEITASGVSGKTFEKSLVLKAPGTISDTTVKGDLIIGAGVGDGDVTLDNVKVKGKLIVYGGGSNSITLKGTTTVPSMVLAKDVSKGAFSSQPVHIVTEGSAKITKCEVVAPEPKLTAEASAPAPVSGAIVDAKVTTLDIKSVGTEVKTGDKAEITTVTITEAPKSASAPASAAAPAAKVEVGGTVQTVKTDAPAVSVEVTGKVETVQATSNAKGAEVVVAKTATVTTVEIKVEIKIEIAGTVTTITISADAGKVEVKIDSTAHVENIESKSADAELTVETGAEVTAVEAVEGTIDSDSLTALEEAGAVVTETNPETGVGTTTGGDVSTGGAPGGVGPGGDTPTTTTYYYAYGVQDGGLFVVADHAFTISYQSTTATESTTEAEPTTATVTASGKLNSSTSYYQFAVAVTAQQSVATKSYATSTSPSATFTVGEVTYTITFGS